MKEQDENVTKGVQDLLGDPKRAILKISIPMMIGMLVQSVYNVVDGFWVAGLGADELAAIGLFFPFFIIIIALGAGIGVGGSSAISRKIGEGNKRAADNTAIHTILLGIIVGLAVGLPLLPFLDDIFSMMSENERVGHLAAEYAKILFGSAVVVIFSHIANAILRGEGDAKRAMYGLILGFGLNIVLDPLFIYTLGLGVLGAALATMASMIVSGLLFIYWLFIKKNTFVNATIKHFKFDKDILNEILRVGIPSSLAQLSMSIAMVFLNLIIIAAGGTDGVAVFTSGWRIVMIGIIPLVGLAMGVTAVTGAAYGAQDKMKLNTSYLYAIKIGVIIELSMAIVIVLFAPQVAYIFTYSENAARIFSELVVFLRIVAIFYPAVPFGMLASAMFRGIDEGPKSLIANMLRAIVFQVPIAHLLGNIIGIGLTGIWTGIVIGNIMGAVVAFVWGKITIKNITADWQ